MARCWSCGAEIPGGWRYWITCPSCSQAEEVKRIRKRLESSGVGSLSSAVAILELGFGELSEQLVNIASVLEWGFEEIEWRLDQIRGILKSIEKTLKIPSATQANEWRQIAEELRQRGELDESEKFFLKSLKTNPLDYRTYIGLGKTELQIGKPEEAKTFWEKSLPHAPKGEIDYKSYSYRLIGRLYFCEENYRQAVSVLKTSIQLSPNYYLGHYDYAQYCALVGDKENCLSSLQIAIVKEPIPTELVKRESNFEPLKNGVERLLNSIQSKGYIQKEIKFRLTWKKLGLGNRCITRLLNTANEFEMACKHLTSVDYLRRNSLYKAPLNLTTVARHDLENIIKDEFRLKYIHEVNETISNEIDKWCDKYRDRISKAAKESLKVLEPEREVEMAKFDAEMDAKIARPKFFFHRLKWKLLGTPKVIQRIKISSNSSKNADKVIAMCSELIRLYTKKETYDIYIKVLQPHDEGLTKHDFAKLVETLAEEEGEEYYHLSERLEDILENLGSEGLIRQDQLKIYPQKAKGVKKEAEKISKKIEKLHKRVKLEDSVNS